MKILNCYIYNVNKSNVNNTYVLIVYNNFMVININALFVDNNNILMIL